MGNLPAHLGGRHSHRLKLRHAGAALLAVLEIRAHDFHLGDEGWAAISWRSPSDCPCESRAGGSTMNALYGLYADAAGAQRAFDVLRSASSELKFRSQQIVVVAGEPHEGYEFFDAQATSTPYLSAVLGAA